MSTTKEAKEKIRADIVKDNSFSGLKEEDAGRAAEQVRKLPHYRKARRVYVDLDASLAQVRLNVLLDGKELIAPAAGLKGGYFVLKPFKVPFKDLSFAITQRGLPKHAERLVSGTLAATPISLFMTTALALDVNGMRLSDGNGFFDLSCAILRAYQPRIRPAVFVVGDDDIILNKTIPVERWDVRATGLVTAQGVRMFSESPAALPPIIWNALTEDRIRKNDFLWKLFNRKSEKITGRKLERFPEADQEDDDEGEHSPSPHVNVVNEEQGRRPYRQKEEKQDDFRKKPRQPHRQKWGRSNSYDKTNRPDEMTHEDSYRPGGRPRPKTGDRSDHTINAGASRNERKAYAPRNQEQYVNSSNSYDRTKRPNEMAHEDSYRPGGRPRPKAGHRSDHTINAGARRNERKGYAPHGQGQYVEGKEGGHHHKPFKKKYPHEGQKNTGYREAGEEYRGRRGRTPGEGREAVPRTGRMTTKTRNSSGGASHGEVYGKPRRRGGRRSE